MQEFHTDTLGSKFIKNLLKSTPLPIYPSINRGDYTILGHNYYYDGNIIKSTASRELAQNYTVIADVDIDSTFIPYSSKYSYYDTETHEYLGKYLDYYRSTTGIDLKPLYNCFSDRYNDRFIYRANYRSNNGENIKNYIFKQESNLNSNVKVIMVPIKFDKVYTIALDSSSEVIMRPFFFNNGEILENLSAKINNFKCANNFSSLIKSVPNLDIEADNFKEKSKPCVVSKMFFSRPNLFEVFLNDDSLTTSEKDILKSNEKYLYLFIQMQKTNKSSIVVLEGNYANRDTRNIINFDKYAYGESTSTLAKNFLERNKDNYFNFLFSNIDNNYTQFKETAVIKALDSIEKDKSTSFLFTFPSLLKLNTQKSYAFSDRLIEYLVHNVITGQDELSGNVIAVNNRFGIFNNQNVPEPEWSKTTQLRVFLDMVNKNIDDINGYIDKDTEESLGW